MAYAKFFEAVPTQVTSSTGTADGRVATAKPYLYRVGQVVALGSGTPTARFEVKRVTATELFLGPVDRKTTTHSDLTGFPGGTSIFAAFQIRPVIPLSGAVDRISLTEDQEEHEEDPVNAKRVLLVGQDGNPYGVVSVDGVNRLPVDANVSVSTGDITVSAANPAINTFDTATGVLSGTTTTVVTYVAGGTWKCRGLSATGSSDGIWTILYGGVAKYQVRTSATQPSVELVLPNPDATAASQVIEISVKNNGDFTGDYSATLFGE